LKGIVKIPSDTALKGDGVVGEGGRRLEWEELNTGAFSCPEDLSDLVLHRSPPNERELIKAAFDQEKVLFVEQSGEAGDLAWWARRGVVVKGGGVLGEVKPQEQRGQQAFDKTFPCLFFEELACLIKLLAIFPSQVHERGQANPCHFFESGEQKSAGAVVEIAHGCTQVALAAFPTLQGFKAATFDVKVHEVGKPVVPAINDDLAKTLGVDDLAKLKGQGEPFKDEQQVIVDEGEAYVTVRVSAPVA